TDNNLYGTLSNGGQNDNGSLFSTDTTGVFFKVIHYFTGPEGSNPQCTPLPDGNGNLYGTCYAGGASGNGPAWLASTGGSRFGDYYGFTGVNGDGALPYSGGKLAVVTGRTAFNLYLEGTTFLGGTNGQGAIFGVGLVAVQEFVVHSFNNGLGEGANPVYG